MFGYVPLVAYRLKESSKRRNCSFTNKVKIKYKPVEACRSNLIITFT